MSSSSSSVYFSLSSSYSNMSSNSDDVYLEKLINKKNNFHLSILNKLQDKYILPNDIIILIFDYIKIIC